jgi:tRNA(adenine34) deaminase
MSEQPQDEFFMRQALAVAEDGLANGELPIGAAVVAEGRVIASAYTQERTQGRLLVHADLLALEAADRIRPFPGRRRDAVLYVNLEPCLMCMGAAMSLFIGRVVYGLESPHDGAADIVRNWKARTDGFPGYHPPQLTGGLLRDESVNMLRRYVEKHATGPMSDWARHLVEYYEGIAHDGN